MTTESAMPVRFDPSLESPAADEAETIAGLKDAIHTVQDIAAKDYGRAVRGVHAKAHGLIRGTLTVAADLPPELAQGLFATPGAHPAILRISTNPGDILDDSISVPRGAALKILDVTGDRLPDSHGDTTQDFVMANAPAFAAADPKAFLGNLRRLAKTTDQAEGLKKALSAVLQVAEGAIEAVGGKSALLTSLGGAPNTHPLGETFYTQTAFRYGDYVAKLSLVPVSHGLTELTGSKVNTHNRPDALRHDVSEAMIEQGGTWDLRVQLLTDRDAMPIEDASVPWDEKKSPYRTVATLVAEPQQSWEPGTTERTEDRMAFSPWHGLAAHQPLGAINRARRPVYQSSVEFRGRTNGCPIHEPRAMEDLTV